jgi:para-nitrobenzyl esterase
MEGLSFPQGCKRLLATVVLTASAVMGAGAASRPADTPSTIVTVEGGRLRGTLDRDILSFKGIPYAAPPVGPLRWRPPQPAVAWRGDRDAGAFGADCMQPRESRPGTEARPAPSEDCLFVNVWRPAAAGKRSLPVLVWIHGGAFITGGSSSPTQDGARLAAHGLVVVSLNYRLGRFGFFGFPALTQEHPAEPHGNYAYMDQLSALRWVHRNIAAFGGDPDQVTVMGESAGGEAVAALLAAPQAAGLFRRVILQSSGARSFLAGMSALGHDRPGLPSAERIGVAFARSAGIAGEGAAALQALRALDPPAIAAGITADALMRGDTAATYTGPMIDGRIVAEEPRLAYLAGRTMKVDLLSGATSADLGMAAAPSKDALFDRFGAARTAAVAAYDPDSLLDLPTLAKRIGSDQLMVEPARMLAALAGRHGQAAYEYRFAYLPVAKRIGRPVGPRHGADVPFAFDRLEAAGYPVSAQDSTMAAIVCAYFANFARQGDPNGPGLPRWPRYTVAADTIMMFKPDGSAHASADPWKARLDVVADHALGTKP